MHSSPEVADVLKGVCVVHRDGVAVHSSKVLSSMAEAALLAGLHTELLHQPAFEFYMYFTFVVIKQEPLKNILLCTGHAGGTTDVH